jgi:oxygen-independent coproporphyrinogen-3 oxidase
VHLYFHVPFCARRCSYCDFAIAVRREVPSRAYVEAALQEWAARLREPPWDREAVVETIYFGGGTPSRLEPRAIDQLLDRIRSDRRVSLVTEITLEANPDDVSRTAAAAWRAAGVNRLSLGAQSFSVDALRWMHRTHDPHAIGRAVEAARASGFDNISLDLIFALPDAIQRNWAHDLDRALALAPEHVSLYGLTTEPGTPLARWSASGRIRPTDDGCYADEYLLAHERLSTAGFEHYEVSNAGRPGYRSRHNSAYWTRAPYLGIGPSAHSGHGNRREWNIREWAAYERSARAGAPLIEGRETLDQAAVRLEEIYLGLRTLEGIPRDWIPESKSAEWRQRDWALVSDGRLSLTLEGWLRLDALVAAL